MIFAFLNGGVEGCVELCVEAQLSFRKARGAEFGGLLIPYTIILGEGLDGIGVVHLVPQGAVSFLPWQ